MNHDDDDSMNDDNDGVFCRMTSFVFYSFVLIWISSVLTSGKGAGVARGNTAAEFYIPFHGKSRRAAEIHYNLAAENRGAY